MRQSVPFWLFVYRNVFACGSLQKHAFGSLLRSVHSDHGLSTHGLGISPKVHGYGQTKPSDPGMPVHGGYPFVLSSSGSMLHMSWMHRPGSGHCCCCTRAAAAATVGGGGGGAGGLITFTMLPDIDCSVVVVDC